MKTMLVALVIWWVPSSGSAQVRSSVEVKGGLNAATLAVDSRTNRYGFSGGLAGRVRWPVAERFSLAAQLEVLYTPRGARVIRDGTASGGSRQRYLDVVILVRPGARLGPANAYLLLGGGMNILLSAFKENDGGGGRDITDELHRLDVALVGGAGVALPLPRRSLGPLRLGTVFLEARHDRGLLDVDAVNGGYRNRNTSVMLGLSFALGSGPVDVRPASAPARISPLRFTGRSAAPR